jgi:hypothetical protein
VDSAVPRPGPSGALVAERHARRQRPDNERSDQQRDQVSVPAASTTSAATSVVPSTSRRLAAAYATTTSRDRAGQPEYGKPLALARPHPPGHAAKGAEQGKGPHAGKPRVFAFGVAGPLPFDAHGSATQRTD